MRIRIINSEEIAFSETSGISYNIYFAGCSLHCNGCHNPQLWDTEAGEYVEVDTIIENIKNNLELIDSVCILGGEPTDQLPGLLALLGALQSLPVSIWVYTGRDKHEPQAAMIYNLCDVIKCGKYVQEPAKQAAINSEGEYGNECTIGIELASSNQYFIYGGRI